VATAQSRLGVAGAISNPAVWLQFLTELARTAFRGIAAAPRSTGVGAPESREILDAEEVLSPHQLLQELYGVIDRELGQTSLRTPVEMAASAFANHPDVERLLRKSRPKRGASRSGEGE
jgi:hypothetical protein